MNKKEQQILNNIEVSFNTEKHIINIRVSSKVMMEVHTEDHIIYLSANKVNISYPCRTIYQLEQNIYSAVETAAVLEEF